MAERKHITLEIPRPLGPAFIHVPLPFDKKARGWVDDQIERVKVTIRREEIPVFREKLNWLPTTLEQLEASEKLHAAGMNYHDACAKALGHVRCECPDCEPRKQEAR